MTGLELVMGHLLKALGVEEKDLEALRNDIPKFRTAIPQFAAAVDNKMVQIEARLATIELKLEEILMKVDPDYADQELPPLPPNAAMPHTPIPVTGAAPIPAVGSSTGSGAAHPDTPKKETKK